MSEAICGTGLPAYRGVYIGRAFARPLAHSGLQGGADQRTSFLRLSHHSPRFQPTQTISARLSAIAEPKRNAARCITAIPPPKPIRPQRLFASSAAVGGPPMRGCRINIMLMNTRGISAMTPLMVGPTQPDNVTTVATSVDTSAARNGISYQRRVISGILT